MANESINLPAFMESEPYSTLHAQPLGFIDVGARGGIHKLVEPVAAATAVLAFEPDEQECQRLRAEATLNSPWANLVIEPRALAFDESERALHVYSSPVNCSLLQPNAPLIERYHIAGFETLRVVPLKTTNLDQILSEPGFTTMRCGELLKLDAQGLELEILQGAERTLTENTVAIVTEVEFFQIYQDQVLFSEVELYLRQRGFSFYGFAALHHRSRKFLDKHNEVGRERLISADAIFFKDPLGSSERLGTRACHVLFVCALLLKHYDFTLELALATWARGPEATRVRDVVRASATVPSSAASTEVELLAERLRKDPKRSNIEIGRFVDKRRCLSDYDDVQ